MHITAKPLRLHGFYRLPYNSSGTVANGILSDRGLVYTDTVNFRRARAHHRMYHVIIGSMGVAASYKLSELMAMELQFSREFSLFHAILSLSTHGENLSMASQVIFCSHCDDFVSRAPYYRP